MIGSALRNLFLLALGLAVLIWVVAQVEQNPETRDVISGIPVEIREPGRGLEVSSIDQATTSVFVSAPQNVWSRLDSRSFRAWIDLTGKDAGAHDITINVTCSERWARILRVTPAYVQVTLERMKEKVVPVVVSVLDDAPSGYSMGQTVVTPTQVLISGRQSIVDQVTEAVAQVRVEGARADIARPARPLLRDGRGAEVKGSISVAPESVTVAVPIFALTSYRTVSMRAVISGTVAAGYRISSIVVEPQTLTLGGDPRTLESIPFIDTGAVDVSGARSDVTKPARFLLPAGVASDRKSDVFVYVKVEPIPGQEIIRRPVVWLNLDKSLRVVAPVSPTNFVDIQLAGPLADLSAVAATDITVTVNLTGVTAGVFERIPVVTGVTKTLTVSRITPEKLIILIEAVPTPTPTPTKSAATPPAATPPAATPTPASTPPPTATPTALDERRWRKTSWARA